MFSAAVEALIEMVFLAVAVRLVLWTTLEVGLSPALLMSRYDL